MAEPLYREDPDYADIHAIHQIATNRVRGNADRGTPASEARSEP